jgi:ribosomal protein S18 acetylase RimI-like enzyme
MLGVVLSDPSQLSKEKIKRASKVLSQAFYNDPLMLYLFPEHKERKSKLQYMMELLLRIGFKYGVITVTSLNLEGIAIWFPSNKSKITAWMGLLNGGITYLFKLGNKAVKKQNRLYKYIYSKHKKLVPNYHCYLSIIAINPLYQGKGLSHVLFNSMFNQIDKHNLSCFLDTNNRKNVNIYKRFGFKILEKYQIPETNVVNWAMIRD